VFKAHIKLHVLEKLSREDLSGYDLMKCIGEFGEKPSPGYMYPLLKDLEKKGFISVKRERRRKVYSLTAKGRRLLEELKRNREEMLKRMSKLWASIADKKEISEFMESVRTHRHGPGMAFRDRDMMVKFNRALFMAYRPAGTEKRKKIMHILDEAARKLERLRKAGGR
jgi:DNA-binding PadR family transcriptional regulator